MKSKITLFSLFVLIALFSYEGFAQKKTGKRWKMGAVPAIAYDADMGFRYGALANFYDHGPNMELYPRYRHSIYAEWSHTTNNNDIKQMKYDSEYLIPGIRVTAIARLETEQAMDFYGFNGYESNYNANLANALHDDYISRMYYRMGLQSLRVRADFQGKIIDRKLRWYAGVSHYNLKINPVDIDKINAKKDDDAEKLPNVPSLYDEYVTAGIIPAEQVNGGSANLIKAGLVADTRDKEANPNSGLWTEAFLVGAPGFIGNDSPYLGMVLTHRQYFPIKKDKLIIAYRLNYQTTLAGEAPWFMLAYKPDTYISWYGLGGAKTLRGVMRNRVVGQGAVLGNFEVRWRFVDFNFIGQDWYLALSPFMDAGMVTKKFVNQPNMTGDKDGIHIGYGVGLHIALNENFIVAVDYGMAADPRDGSGGSPYIGLDFLF